MIEKGVEECKISYTTQKLEEMLISFFDDKIVICSGGNKKGNMIYSSNMTCDNAMDVSCNNERQLENKIRDVAFSLRKRLLPEELKVEDILSGEIDIPDPLQSFFCHLLMGPDLRRGETERQTRRVKSLSQDAIRSH